jgi:hypothetical protein
MNKVRVFELFAGNGWSLRPSTDILKNLLSSETNLNSEETKQVKNE